MGILCTIKLGLFCVTSVGGGLNPNGELTVRLSNSPLSSATNIQAPQWNASITRRSDLIRTPYDLDRFEKLCIDGQCIAYHRHCEHVNRSYLPYKASCQFYILGERGGNMEVMAQDMETALGALSHIGVDLKNEGTFTQLTLADLKIESSYDKPDCAYEPLPEGLTAEQRRELIREIREDLKQQKLACAHPYTGKEQWKE